MQKRGAIDIKKNTHMAVFEVQMRKKVFFYENVFIDLISFSQN